jgi:hypothetical protein
MLHSGKNVLNLNYKDLAMEPNTLQYCRFKRGGNAYEVEYFLTKDPVCSHAIVPGHLWLVISLVSSQPHTWYVSKSVAILRQPAEVISVIVQRETMEYLVQLSSVEAQDACTVMSDKPINTNDGTSLVDPRKQKLVYIPE